MEQSVCLQCFSYNEFTDCSTKENVPIIARKLINQSLSLVELSNEIKSIHEQENY